MIDPSHAAAAAAAAAAAMPPQYAPEGQKRRMSTADFEALALIGRGAFGEVRLVRQRSTREVFALKSMIKQAMVVKNQVTHLRNERDLLVAVADSPWIVELKYSFQDERQLYMVMEFLDH